MKIDKISMTVDSDINSKKVIDAAVDNDVDRIVELDPDQTYIRSYIDNMDIVDESFTMLRESAEVPKEFVNFAYDMFNDLREDFERPVNRQKFPFGTKSNDIKKSKPRIQYTFNIKGFIAQKTDPVSIKSTIAKKYGMIKLYDADLFDKGNDVVYGKLTNDNKYIIALTNVEILTSKKTSYTYTSDGSISVSSSSNDSDLNAGLRITITCFKVDEKILKKIDKSDYKSAKEYLNNNLNEKDKTAFEKYLEGSFGKSPLINHTEIHEQEKRERTHDEDYLKIIYEYCDLSDPEFKKNLIYVNEAEQNKVLMSLTAKLYATIVDKANEIDYGDIPDTKGDITKLRNYNVMVDTVATLRDIVKEYKQDPKAVNVISEAIANIETHKDDFTKSFRLNYEFPKLLYCSTVIAILDSISYLIATCIEFIKSPKNDTFDMILDVMRYKKAREYVIFTNLEKLNGEFKNGNIDKINNAITKGAIKNVKEAGFIVPAIIIGGVIVASVIIILLSVLGLIRNIVFAIYNARNEYSIYWDLQSMVLEANANSLELNHPDWDDKKKKKVYDRQMKIVERWRKRAEKFRVTAKKSEVDAEKEIKNIEKIDRDEFEDASKYDSSLF